MKKIFRVACTCCWNPQILFYIWADGIPTAIFLIKYKLEYFSSSLCSNKLKSSGACFRGNLIIIPNDVYSPIDRGGRFGNGFFGHEDMRAMGFLWREYKYGEFPKFGYGRPETWKLSGKMIKNVHRV